MTTKSTFNSDLFIEFINWIRDYIPSKQIFVANNTSLHKTQNVAQYFQNKNLLLQTIPAYSPWMNPAEKLVSSIKSKIRKSQQTGRLVSLSLIKRIIQDINQSNLKSYFDMSLFETAMFINS